MSVLAPPVRIVSDGAPPFVQAPNAPPFVVYAGTGPNIGFPITVVADGAPPITLLNEDGSTWSEDGDGISELFGANDGFYPVKPGYVYTDVAGTTPANTDGALIACFRAQYGGLPDLVQATASLRPQLKDAGGGLWYALGDGVDDIWTSTGTFTAAANEQMSAVAIRRATQTAGDYFRVGISVTNRHGILGTTSGNRLQSVYRFSGGTIYSTELSAAFPTGVDVVCTARITATTLDIAADQGSPTSVAAVGQSITSATLGFPTAVSNNARLYGFALYQAATVSAGDRTAIVTALAALQGRTI
jgi:hypothetical protein